MGKHKDHIYYAINSMFIGTAAIGFWALYRRLGEFFLTENLFTVAVLIFSVILVHLIKAARLCLALYGNGIRMKDYLKIYCKVTPVSILIPFKLGEIFRMYCYGKQIRSVLKGIIIVLLDRFMDTTALIFIIFTMRIIRSGEITAFMYLLLLFLLVLITCYLIFPNFYAFWKKYMLNAKGSEYRLWVLDVLENLHHIYSETEQVIRGRGFILLFLSLAAWAVEIGAVMLALPREAEKKSYNIISDYLLSAITGGNSNELSRFVFASVVGLVIGFIALKLTDKLHRRGDI